MQAAAMLVIGDEILSGRTRDANVSRLGMRLGEIGVSLAEVRIVPDIHRRIAEAAKELAAEYDCVFTSGGIGPTHDDITAEAIAMAFGADLEINPEARAILQRRCDETGAELNEARLRMARVPKGGELIENPVSGAPGFRVGNVYVMAGIPEVFEAMLESALPGLSGGDPILSRTLTVMRPEGEIAEPLGKIAASRPELSFGSYPFARDGRFGSNIVMRGTDGKQLETACAELQKALGQA